MEGGVAVDDALITEESMLNVTIQKKVEVHLAEDPAMVKSKPVQTKSQAPVSGTNKKRVRVSKELLLKKFTKLQEINLTRFDKDVLQWLEMFSSQP